MASDRFNVRYWHKADVLTYAMHVRYRGQSGHDVEWDFTP
jgi:hypothetical protein